MRSLVTFLDKDVVFHSSALDEVTNYENSGTHQAPHTWSGHGNEVDVKIVRVQKIIKKEERGA